MGEISNIIAGGDKNINKIKKYGKYPVIANSINKNGIVGYYDNEYRVKAPAVTVTGRGEIGHAVARFQNFTPIVRLLALSSKLDPIFLANSINKIRFFNESTGVPQLTKPQLSTYSIIIPSVEEQNNIGKLILLIEKYIHLQQRKLSLIKTLKRSFLSDLFFKTSTNSIVITLKQVTSIRGGYAFKSKEFTENGYPIIKIANISNNGEIKGPYSYTNNFNKKYILTKNDIVLAMSGATTGKIAKLRSSKSFLQNQRIGYFCKTNNIDYNYLYYLLISDQFKKQLKRITIAGAQPNVSSLDIENFRFSVLSSKNKQKKISDFLNKLDIKIRITNKKITIFSQLKRSLLNNMFI